MNKEQLIQKFKSHHRYLYGAVRDVIKQGQAFRVRHDQPSVIHTPQAKPTSPLSIITTTSHTPRLNAVFDRLDSKTITTDEVETAITLAVKFSEQYHYQLRIITRNNSPNPQLFVDFLKRHRLQVTENYSFYTDSDTRISPETRHLDLTQNDVFFATSASSLQTILHTPIPNRHIFCLSSVDANPPENVLLVTKSTPLLRMKGWIDEK